ncbi:cupin domain-containing protein [Streptomyces sp. ISL-11]|uniref:cupin domain-containing protein n=1 Tax=Streptomyces sp. ISL-11 TaxID=2819174 RepID=UPI001BEA22B2|nr:cupin domain-containing protein [Streptomyces sp. ISL-11]MBT2383466.1 cupin domain-containing protein [Streptomyces sp. ISL-11]
MIVRDMSDSRLTDAYGIRYQQVYPHGGEDLADWGLGRAVVPPGGETEPHDHHEEHEAFVLISGSGLMVIDDETRPVTAPSAVLIPNGSRHQLKNASATEPLVFLSLYWPPSMGPVDL